MRTKLTEKKVRGLTATGTPCDILHDRTPSAGLRLTALGAKIWFYLYRSPAVRDDRVPRCQPLEEPAHAASVRAPKTENGAAAGPAFPISSGEIQLPERPPPHRGHSTVAD